MSGGLDWRIEMLLDMAAANVRDTLVYPGIARELEEQAHGIFSAVVAITPVNFRPWMNWREWRDAVLFPLVGTQFDKTVYVERAA